MRGLSYALVLLIGGLVGFYFTSLHYISSIQNADDRRAKATQKRDELDEEIFDRWREDLLIAESKPPIVITDRVLVKGNCPVRAEEGKTSMDDGEIAFRFELDERLVQNLARMSNDKEKMYAKCHKALSAYQEAERND